MTILRRAPDIENTYGNPVIQWECKCDCGRIVFRKTSTLLRNKSQCEACRAKADSIKHKHGEIYRHNFYCMQKNAEARKFPFTVTIEYVWDLFLKQNRKCALSGIPLIFAASKKGHITGETTASLDRIDSKLGYVPGNVQWLHKWVNLMKSDFTTEEFLSYCRKVVNYNKRKIK